MGNGGKEYPPGVVGRLVPAWHDLVGKGAQGGDRARTVSCTPPGIAMPNSSKRPTAKVADILLAMVFKAVESAQERWRAITAPHLVALVRNGARFENGHLVERPENTSVA